MPRRSTHDLVDFCAWTQMFGHIYFYRKLWPYPQSKLIYDYHTIMWTHGIDIFLEMHPKTTTSIDIFIIIQIRSINQINFPTHNPISSVIATKSISNLVNLDKFSSNHQFLNILEPWTTSQPILNIYLLFHRIICQMLTHLKVLDKQCVLFRLIWSKRVLHGIWNENMHEVLMKTMCSNHSNTL